jgi:hypothetical protein
MTRSGFALLLLTACGGDDAGRRAEAPPPPPACPGGTSWDGARCAPLPPPSSSAPGATATATPPVPGVPLPVPTAAPGPLATPLDATSSAAAAQLLGPLAQRHAPRGARPVGALVAGQFLEGQSLEGAIQMQPGRCYTVVAAGLPPVTNLDVQIVPALALPGVGAPIVAQDRTSAATAVIGEQPSCFRWAAPLAGPMKLILTVSAGQGVAAAQVYES